MKVPFRLRRRGGAEPATALLLFSHAPEDVLRLCARLGQDPLPVVYAVAEGFLLKLARPPGGAIAGGVRLRGLSANLLLPVDADLEPALLPDEAAALVRDRGLVFLPGGRVLEFAPNSPVRLAALLVGPTARASWRPLPRPRPLADRVTEVVEEIPPEAAEEVLEAGGEGIGTETPRPADSGLPAKLFGKAALGLGKGLAWLGHKLGLGGLTGLGASLMAKAMSLAPRLSEALMGKHEASLRDLLRDFQEGNLERALRHALPIGGDAPRGASPHQADRLPLHDPSYSLWDFLRGQGANAGLWFGREETYRLLGQEYRRAAEQAARAGDHRRAAFIYGKLLGDYRRAAAVLAEGGLHRDAALIYLHKLSDPQSAARAYEAAGDVDRALRHYRRCGEHALVGDLLRKAGEEELAVAEYQLAAAKLVADGQGHYPAGELLLSRARRMDLAVPHYQESWKHRPFGAPVPSAIRLAQIYTEQEDSGRLLELLAEAEPYLRPEGNDGPAGEFFNEVARLAEKPGLARVQDELRDRALLGLAGKMRQRVEGSTAGGVVSALMGAATVWAPPVVSDADFAVKRALAPPPEPRLRSGRAASTLIRARVPVVTAVCWAPDSGAIVLGFESGEVVLFRPLLGEVVPISREDHPVAALAISPGGESLVVLSEAEGAGSHVTSYTRGAGYRMTNSQPIQSTAAPLLCPLLLEETPSLAGLWDGVDMRFLRMPNLLVVDRWMTVPAEAVLKAALIVPSAWRHPSGPRPLDLFLFANRQIGYAHGPIMTSKLLLRWKAAAWRPAVPTGGNLRRPVFAWLHTDVSILELAAIGPGGALYWTQLDFPGGQLEVRGKVTERAEPYLAATLVRSKLVAAVTARAVYWLRITGRGFTQAAEYPEGFPDAVACYPHQAGNELIVVCGDGTVARVPAPRL